MVDRRPGPLLTGTAAARARNLQRQPGPGQESVPIRTSGGCMVVSDVQRPAASSCEFPSGARWLRVIRRADVRVRGRARAMRSPLVRSRFFFARLPLGGGHGASVARRRGRSESPITFDVSIGTDSISVVNTADAPTNVRLRDSDGNTKATSVLGNTDPFFDLPAGVTVEIGDRIRASDGKYVRTFIVPDLSITIDRVTDVFQGTGPAQRTIKVGWGGRFGDVFEEHGVRVRPDGTWSLSAPFDVLGRPGRFSRLGDAKWRLGSHWRRGCCPDRHSDRPASSVTRVSRSPTWKCWSMVRTMGNGPDKAAISEASSGRLRRANGDLIGVAPGDHITASSVASDLDWVVPDVHIDADASTELVTGQCGGTVAVIELYRTGQQRGLVLARPGDNDEFEFDFSDPFASDYVTGIGANEANVKHGDSLRVDAS